MFVFLIQHRHVKNCLNSEILLRFTQMYLKHLKTLCRKGFCWVFFFFFFLVWHQPASHSADQCGQSPNLTNFMLNHPISSLIQVVKSPDKIKVNLSCTDEAVLALVQKSLITPYMLYCVEIWCKNNVNCIYSKVSGKNCQ